MRFGPEQNTWSAKEKLSRASEEFHELAKELDGILARFHWYNLETMTEIRFFLDGKKDSGEEIEQIMMDLKFTPTPPRAVLESALNACLEWKKSIQEALNFSAQDLENSGFEEKTRDALEALKTQTVKYEQQLLLAMVKIDKDMDSTIGPWRPN